MKFFKNKQKDEKKNPKPEEEYCVHSKKASVLKKGGYFLEGMGGGLVTATTKTLIPVTKAAYIGSCLIMLVPPVILVVAPIKVFLGSFSLCLKSTANGAKEGTKNKFSKAFGKTNADCLLSFSESVRKEHPIKVLKTSLKRDWKNFWEYPFGNPDYEVIDELSETKLAIERGCQLS